jgi:hypothetical protein
MDEIVLESHQSLDQGHYRTAVFLNRPKGYIVVLRQLAFAILKPMDHP